MTPTVELLHWTIWLSYQSWTRLSHWVFETNRRFIIVLIEGNMMPDYACLYNVCSMTSYWICKWIWPSSIQCKRKGNGWVLHYYYCVIYIVCNVLYHVDFLDDKKGFLKKISCFCMNIVSKISDILSSASVGLLVHYCPHSVLLKVKS